MRRAEARVRVGVDDETRETVMGAEARLAELGISLPSPPAPVASYVPFVISGRQVFVSGQLPMVEGKLVHTGLVGRDITVEDATADARQAAINSLAHLRIAAGTLDRVARIVRVGVFVASSEGLHAQPTVANGASDLYVAVFGDAGRHARAAVGVAALPLGASVEVELIAELAE